MKYLSLLLPALFVALFIYALCKKVKLYDSFTAGVKGAIPLAISLFPYLAVMLILSELFEHSGLSSLVNSLFAPLFEGLGIPKEITPLVLMKPFSGSGSTALLSNLLSQYGAESYIARCACVCYGSSETVFYISAVYFASGKSKRPLKPVFIALLANFVTVIVGCALCRIL